LGGDNLFLSLLVLLLSIFCVAFFSSSEASLLAVNKVRIRHLSEKGSRAAKAVERVWHNYDKLLATILFTENLFIIFASSIGTALALSLVGPEGVYVATLVMTGLIVILGEITPKTFAARNAERYSLLVGRPIEAIIALERPVIGLLTATTNFILRLLGGSPKEKAPFVTEEELRMQIRIAEQERVIARAEQELLHNVVKFGDRVVREVMVPRREIVGLEAEGTIADFLRLFARAPHSRFPVFRESLDNILGVIGIKDVLRAVAADPGALSQSLAPLMREVPFVPEGKRLGDLFLEMRANNIKMAIVIDEYGGTAGLVTIENLIEQIVGDMRDELARPQEEVVRLDDDRAILHAGLAVEEVNELLHLNLPLGEYETVAGLLLSHLGRVPAVGESIAFNGLEVTVAEMRGVKIERVQISGLRAAKGGQSRVGPS